MKEIGIQRLGRRWIKFRGQKFDPIPKLWYNIYRRRKGEQVNCTLNSLKFKRKRRTTKHGKTTDYHKFRKHSKGL